MSLNIEMSRDVVSWSGHSECGILGNEYLVVSTPILTTDLVFKRAYDNCSMALSIPPIYGRKYGVINNTFNLSSPIKMNVLSDIWQAFVSDSNVKGIRSQKWTAIMRLNEMQCYNIVRVIGV